MAAARPRRTPRRALELAAHKAVAQYLDLVLDPARAAWTHFPAGEKRSPQTAAKLKAMGLKPGWPDFIVTWNARDNGDGGVSCCLGLEIKAARGRKSAAQEDTFSRLRSSGWWIVVVRDVDDAAEALADAGAPLRSQRRKGVAA